LVAAHLESRRSAIGSESVIHTNQAQLRTRAVDHRISALDGELSKVVDEVSLQTRRRQLAERNVQRFEALVAANFVSLAQLQGHEESLLEQNARLQALERLRLNLWRERTSLVAERSQIAANLAGVLAAAKRDMLVLEQEATENAGRRTAVVVAPQAGTVSALGIGLGQWATAGQTLAALHPLHAPLEAHLFAPSRTAGFVAPGQRVLLRYAAYPYQKFGLQEGQVVTVSQSAFAPNDLPPNVQIQFGSKSPEALFRITVGLVSQNIATYGEDRALRSGMAVEGSVVQDRRRIYEWILGPALAASGQF
jgi:membrane fusion protein